MRYMPARHCDYREERRLRERRVCLMGGGTDIAAGDIATWARYRVSQPR